MKISKTTQRRTIILAAALAVVALFQVAHITVQMFYSTNPYVKEKNHTFIGSLDTSYQALNIEKGYEEHSIVLERADDGRPLVEALPSSVTIFSTHPDYVRPDHFGWQWNSIITYVALAMFVVIAGLVAWIFLGAIRGFRTGNIFLKSHPRVLRWLAAAVFIYYALIGNREVFRQLAVGELYGDAMPFDLYSALTINTECLVAPLLLLIFAELMAVAARINEEESMTI
ncbi:MAG: hypothetical protein II236_07535 [Alistipes sp.]|nr:hypothetical protein [Alistipes sp.]MBQ5617786.1 hypothetical protein [Alistipes sp.]MBQ5922639.1 hypothetical protein [Alistipes sp.]